MKSHLLRSIALALGLALVTTAAHAGQLNPQSQALVDARLREIAAWAAEPVIVDAVARQNAELPAAYASLNQEKWRLLPAAYPAVSALLTNDVAAWLRGRPAPWLTEAFVSDAAGRKVAFLAKTSNWSHAGKPKHEVPMTGHIWQGEIEVDASIGAHQLQVAVPVLREGKPIGSLVVGINVSAL